MSKLNPNGNADATGAPEALEIAQNTEEAEGLIANRVAKDAAVDEGQAAHQGGLGASGSAPDFGHPENFAGLDKSGL